MTDIRERLTLLRGGQPRRAVGLRAEAANGANITTQDQAMIDKHWCRWDEHDCEAAYEEIERLRAVITRAKDALLDGQSTQWVHDLLVAELTRRALETKP